MKALPWIAVIVLAVIAAVMFRYAKVEVPTPEGERMGTMDRWTGRVDLADFSAREQLLTNKEVDALRLDVFEKELSELRGRMESVVKILLAVDRPAATPHK